MVNDIARSYPAGRANVDIGMEMAKKPGNAFSDGGYAVGAISQPRLRQSNIGIPD
jgi:hypothetical protein